MTDQEAIKIAKQYGLCRLFPVVKIPPTGCINETIIVEWQSNETPKISRNLKCD